MDEDPVLCQSYMSDSFSTEWLPTSNDGQLSLDIFRDEHDLVIRTPLAGVSTEEVDIAIHGDLLTIRGQRSQQQISKEEEWFCRECYWGAFSRSVVLPVDVQGERATASMKNGVLEIRIPLRHTGHRIQIRHE